ncbi:Ger(x)C family spore germination protein [Alkalihalophilus lindianensis]|uniref:Ger(X)C family spore germination protein n=1 Tax=Alkalihalophilus lindianensis TaxID=1630542 RepID=A0ABU3XFT6_9BACI|nr:Ger(x)C family spore germination protein [Alkalihalophilus lindianensis]MDV2686477.1 Ger(x)C family spore germination protein [Alkalihalophilus lindianensis]
MKRLRSMIACLFVAICLGGCWDSANIETFSFIMGIGLGVDQNDPEKVGMVTQLYLPVSENEGASTLTYQNKYSTGESVIEAIRNLELVDQGIMSDHQLALVLHSDALKKWNAEALINQRMRDERARRGLRIFVTEEDLNELFTYPKGDDTAPTSKALDLLAQNNDRTTEIIVPLTLGKLSDSIERAQSILIPNITISEEELKINGAYILKDGKHIDGYLSPAHVSGVNWLNGDVQSGVINAKVNGARVVYEILDASVASVTTSVQEDQLSMHIKVTSDGRLVENWDPNEDAYNADYKQNLETIFEEKLTQEVTTIIELLQKDYQTDPLDLQKYVRVQQYPFWKQYKDDWDAAFQKATITYEVDLTIVDFGTRGKNREGE